MNQQQRSYAMRRLDAIRDRHLQKAIDKCTVPAKTLTPAQKAALLRNGKARLRAGVKEIKGYTDVVDVFDFPGESDEKFDQTAFNGAEARILAAHSKALDELVLGDEQKALELIKAFESFK